MIGRQLGGKTLTPNPTSGVNPNNSRLLYRIMAFIEDTEEEEEEEEVYTLHPTPWNPHLRHPAPYTLHPRTRGRRRYPPRPLMA